MTNPSLAQRVKARFLLAFAATLLSSLLAIVALSSSARAQDLLHTLVSPSERFGGNFGFAVAGVPDADGDQVSDLLVGAMGEGSGFFGGPGRAHLYSGATGALLHTLDLPTGESGGGFAESVAGVFDTNGDSKGDLLIGAKGVGSNGRAYLFSGATGALLHVLNSPSPDPDGGQFGDFVAGVPDTDGDGRGDLLIGADSEGPGFSGTGRAYLFSGATGTLLHVLNSPNAQKGGNFGEAVAGVPDTDGDGRGDLLIGAYFEDPERAYLFSGATGTLLFTLTSPNPLDGCCFGFSVAGVPDVNGDGRGDLLVGAANRDNNFGEGRAYLFSGDSGALLLELNSPEGRPNDRFGLTVAGVPDASGDSKGDLLIGATGVATGGRAYLFSGSSGDLLLEVASPNAEGGGNFGVSVAGVSDANGDGRGDLLIGARREDPGASPQDAGRAYLFSGSIGTLPTVDLTATATSPLTVAPGGSVSFNYSITNTTSVAASGDLFFTVTPGGLSGVITSGTVGAGQTVNASFTQNVPGNAPPGVYAYTLNIGRFPNVTVDAETFAVTVTGSARAAGTSEAWAVTDASPWEPADAPAEVAPRATDAVVTAYPNPFRQQTALSFTLPSPERVRLAVYDVLGREVAVFFDGTTETGQHEATFDGQGLPSGVYLWRLEAGAEVQTGRLTLLR